MTRRLAAGAPPRPLDPTGRTRPCEPAAARAAAPAPTAGGRPADLCRLPAVGRLTT